MPKKAPKKAAAKKISPKRAAPTLDEKGLTKGQLRKLTALRKSVGDEIGNTAFASWLATADQKPTKPADKVAVQIAAAVTALIKDKKLTIPHGGYFLKRGRGRVIVTRAVAD